MAAALKTRHVHLLSIDPCDENHFASAAPPGENVVSVWDRRVLNRISAATMSNPDDGQALLEIRPAISTAVQANLGSLRFSGHKRGAFAVLSSAGQIRMFKTSQTDGTQEEEHMPFGTDEHDLPSNLPYVKKVNELSAPAKVDPQQIDMENPRPIAFDFADPGCFGKLDPIITLFSDRDLKVLESPAEAPIALVSTTNNMAILGDQFRAVSKISSKDTTADVTMTEQSRKPSATTDQTVQLDVLGQGVSDQRKSNRRRHLEPKTDLPKILTALDVQRRRCVEGYLFDCEKNQRIVRENQQLVELWGLIKRMKQMANNNGLTNKGVDFAYLGAFDIWFANTSHNPARNLRKGVASRKDCSNAMAILLASQGYGKFQGAKTEYPGLRQLGLALCGWRFDDRQLRDKCVELISRRQYYKAIVIAVCHGSRPIAIELLRTLTRTRAIENSALAAVIACNTVTDEQRELCDWMAEDTENPYLRSLLTYFVHGTWEPVMEMDELACIYRVGLALKYLEDSKLDKFLRDATAQAVSKGDLEGVILTGLGEPSMDLFQEYMARTNDVQTAVIATAFTNPRYVQNERWDFWKATYLDCMQGWRAFVERTLFITQHARMTAPRTDTSEAPPLANSTVTFQCNSCKKPICNVTDPYDSSDDEDDPESAQNTSDAKGSQGVMGNGVFCQGCGARFGRCAVCLQWQGATHESYDDRRRDDGSQENSGQDTKAGLFINFIGFCSTCHHGYHLPHAQDWFAKHDICAVPGCDCLCALGRP